MTDEMRRHIDELRRGIDSDGLSRAEADASWSAIEARGGGRRSPRVFLAVGVALAVALLAVLLWPAREQAWYRVAEGGSCVTGKDELTVAEGCGEPVVVLGRDRVQVAPGTILATDAHGVRLRRGRARFTIEHRTETEPAFEVALSHGVVRVLGTVFTVEQLHDAGEVVLESGRIEMRWNDGAAPTTLLPGERLSWPRKRAEPTLETESPQERTPERIGPPRREPDAQSADALMQKQFQLRGQRRYRDAAELLEQASKRKDLGKAQRERFSFELGNVLRLDGREGEACAHWRRHAARFPGSAKKPDVRKALDDCEGR